MITGKSSESPHEALYFYYNKNDLEALRSGKWKLEFARQYKSLQGRPGGRDGSAVDYRDSRISRPELYDLDADPGEKRFLYTILHMLSSIRQSP